MDWLIRTRSLGFSSCYAAKIKKKPGSSIGRLVITVFRPVDNYPADPCRGRSYFPVPTRCSSGWSTGCTTYRVSERLRSNGTPPFRSPGFGCRKPASSLRCTPLSRTCEFLPLGFLSLQIPLQISRHGCDVEPECCGERGGLGPLGPPGHVRWLENLWVPWRMGPRFVYSFARFLLFAAII